MAEILTNNKNYYDIADAIRQMKNVSTTYKPREMASALKDIYSNEVEGVPPLTFESNGMPLIDYRIDGASGGVGDLITDSSDTHYNKYKIPVKISGKNLFNPNSGWNLRGSLTKTDYKFPGGLDGNRRTFFYKVKSNTTYTVSVDTPGDRLGIIELSRNINPVNASIDQKITADRIILETSDEPANVYPYTFTTSSTAKIVGIYYSLNTMPINMQIEFGSSPTDYEEYQELDTVDIYLDSPIGANESISLSDTNVDIPTIEGTNVLTIDTTVQPSNVYVQAPKDSIEATQIASELEEI